MIIMKKHLFAFCVLLIMASVFTPLRLYADEIKTDAYAAYCDFLRVNLGKVGHYPPSTINTFSSTNKFTRDGIVYARLVDFDGNGIPELVLIDVRDRAAYWHAYGYWNGSVIELASGRLVTKFDLEFVFCTDGNGKPYFAYYTNIACQEMAYATLYEGKWTTTLMNYNLTSNWSINGYINGKYYNVRSDKSHVSGYSSDGKFIGRDEYLKQEGFLREKACDSYTTGSTVGLSLIKIPDNTPDSVIKELEQFIPAGYLKPSDWAAEAVGKAIEMNLVPDSLQKNYSADITRAEFCALAAMFYEKVTGSEISQRINFADTDDINVRKIAGLGIVSGVGDANFAPNDSLTREQAAVILINLANSLDIPISDGTASFADNGSISDWAISHVGKVQALKIMSGTGDNLFEPKSLYTREQSIITIIRIMDLITVSE